MSIINIFINKHMTFVNQVPPKPNLNPGWLKDAAKEAAKTTTDKKSPLKKKVAPTTPASAAKVEIIQGGPKKSL